MSGSDLKKNIKITEIRTYVPLSHDYADLFANLVASLELCAAAAELWEIWRDKLRDENSKQLVQRMITILSRYLEYPEGRAFSLYQQKEKQEFLKMAERIRSIRAVLEAISVDERNISKLEKIEGRLNQLARNCRAEITRLAKTETIEYDT
jgi:DNA repair ATPase RecN